MRAPDAQDLRVVQGILARGSRSFSAASRLLPASGRGHVAALYAFCRVADDAVDGQDEAGVGGVGAGGRLAVAALHRRLDRIYAGQPADHPVERAFAFTVAAHQIPRALPEALLEGFAWDADGRRYQTLSDVRAYGLRVAGTVGLMMCLIMGRRAAPVLARAADLGVAMQLTNIARDVGEDARNGRVYLPDDLLAAQGLSAEALLAAPRHSPALAAVVKALLDEAEALYRRADQGIAWLPWAWRPAIRAARLIYAEIGAVLAKQDFDAVSSRARTSGPRKLALTLRALGAAFWRPAPLGDPPLAEAAPLIGQI